MRKYLYATLCSALLFFIIPLQGLGQQKLQAGAQQALDAINSAFNKGDMTKTVYLDTVLTWYIASLDNQNLSISSRELINYLKTYKEIAQSEDRYKKHMINYFMMLSKNAFYGYRHGEDIYFMEKEEEEIRKLTHQRPIVAIATRCNLLRKYKNYPQVIAVYNEVKDYLNTFPVLLSNKKINLNIAVNHIKLLSPVTEAYARLGDTTGVEQSILLAENINKEIIQQIKPTEEAYQYDNFFVSQLYFFKYFYLHKNAAKTLESLYNMQQVLDDLQGKHIPLTGYLQQEVYNNTALFFARYNVVDSAAYYIRKLKSSADNDLSYNSDMMDVEADLLAKTGKYEAAYNLVKKSFDKLNTEQLEGSQEKDALLYAFTDAEFNKEALIKSEKVKKQRTITIIIISALSVIIILFIYIMMMKKEKKAKERIEAMNTVANTLTASMEDMKRQGAQEEQQKLGRELHDSFSSSLASVKHLVEQLAINVKEQPLHLVAAGLENIHGRVEEIYTVSRNKSHLLYDANHTATSIAFGKKINDIIETSLPERIYKKEIHIEEEVFDAMDINIRINVLRIIQEAITNIIKHAKATQVSVLVYEDRDILYLKIEDNGRGFDVTKKQSGIGLKSLRERTAEIGGILEIDSGKNGTKVTVRMERI